MIPLRWTRLLKRDWADLTPHPPRAGWVGGEGMRCVAIPWSLPGTYPGTRTPSSPSSPSSPPTLLRSPTPHLFDQFGLRSRRHWHHHNIYFCSFFGGFSLVSCILPPAHPSPLANISSRHVCVPILSSGAPSQHGVHFCPLFLCFPPLHFALFNFEAITSDVSHHIESESVSGEAGHWQISHFFSNVAVDTIPIKEG